MIASRGTNAGLGQSRELAEIGYLASLDRGVLAS